MAKMDREKRRRRRRDWDTTGKPVNWKDWEQRLGTTGHNWEQDWGKMDGFAGLDAGLDAGWVLMGVDGC